MSFSPALAQKNLRGSGRLGARAVTAFSAPSGHNGTPLSPVSRKLTSGLCLCGARFWGVGDRETGDPGRKRGPTLGLTMFL